MEVLSPSLDLPRLKNYRETPQSLGSLTSNTTLSLANGNMIRATIGASLQLTLPAAVDGQSYTLILKYSGTVTLTIVAPGGGGTLVWPGNTTPDFAETANKTDILTFTSDGTYIYGAMAGANYATP